MTNIIKTLKTTLKGTLSTTGTSFTVQKFVDSKSVEIVDADFNGNFVVVLEQGTNIEMILCSGITQSGSDDTAVLTVATNGRHLNPKSPWTGGSTGLLFTAGASVIVTNDPYTMSRLANIDKAQTFSLLQTFTLAPVSNADAVASTELVRKSQLDNAVLGTLSSAPVVVPATAGETVAVDQVVYKKSADSEWYLADADTANNVENVMLGITRGAGTDGVAITNGVTILGEHVASSAIFTANTPYFASNTAGGWATSAGTKEVSLGHATTTTKIDFNPRYDQQITENQQDLIEQQEAGTDWYASTSVGTDAYAITITPAITAYASGQRFRFKADVANTGGATLDVSGLGAKTILKQNDTALATGDIEAGQIVECVYDGTSMQMVSQTASTPSNLDYQEFKASGTWTKPSGLTGDELVVIHMWGAGGAGGSRSATSARGTGSGGGGGFKEVRVKASVLGATETVTIGAGGTAQVDDVGLAGGNTTFGSWFTAYGGGGGYGGTGNWGADAWGGGGGGLFGAGATGSLTAALGGTGGATADIMFGGTDGTNGVGDNLAPALHWGGAGGSRASGTYAYDGGNAVWGGGSGGGGVYGATAGLGGVSLFGGDGGVGGTSSTDGGDGVQPAGGGGSCYQQNGNGQCSGGNGADGEVRVWVIA
jgi:hypothetical protein